MSFRERPWLDVVYVLDEVQMRNICQIDLGVLEAAQISLNGMFQTKDLSRENTFFISTSDIYEALGCETQYTKNG